MFGALKHDFRSMASLILVRNVVGELRPKRTLAASRGFLAAAWFSCFHFGTISYATSYRLSIVTCSRTHRLATIQNVTDDDRETTDAWLQQEIKYNWKSVLRNLE